MNDLKRLALLTLPVLALLPGCSPSGQGNVAPPLANAKIGGLFTLINQDGRTVSDRDFLGKYRIVYFGYTYCPDVCPLDMQHLAQGLHVLDKRNPKLAAEVVPIFISVDPARDTPAVLKQFTGAFDKRIVGLTGTPQQIAAVAREFAVYYQAQPRNKDGAYTVDHSRVAYLFDRQGKPLALVRQDGTPDQVADDIEQWAK